MFEPSIISVRITITKQSDSSSAKLSMGFRLPRTGLKFGRKFFKYLFASESGIYIHPEFIESIRWILVFFESNTSIPPGLFLIV
jgi:hypothetical protein